MSPLKKKAVIEVDKTRGPTCIVRHLFFSADGKTLACTASTSRQVQVFDLATGSALQKIKDEALGTFVLAPDGKTVVTAGKEALRIRETATGAELCRLPGPPGRTLGLAFAPDGKRLASIGEDRVVRVWDVNARKESSTFQSDRNPRSVAFSPDGRRLAVATEGSVVIWTVPAR